MSILSLTSVICFCGRNRRALGCRPSNLLAWGVHDEQLGNPELHRAVQTQLPRNGIARRGPSSCRNKVPELNAKRPSRHKHQLACLESVAQLGSQQVSERGAPSPSIRLKTQSGRETFYPLLGESRRTIHFVDRLR